MNCKHKFTIIKGEKFTMTDKKLYGMEEVRKIIPMSKAGIYKLCAEGQIKTVKLGRRVFVPSWEIDRLLSEPTDGGKGA